MHANSARCLRKSMLRAPSDLFFTRSGDSHARPCVSRAAFAHRTLLIANFAHAFINGFRSSISFERWYAVSVLPPTL